MSVPPDLPRRTAGLGKWELLLDVAAAAAAIFETARIISTGSLIALPILALAVAAAVIRRHLPIAAAVMGILASGLVLFEPDAALPIWVLAEVVLFTLALRAPRAVTGILAAVHAALLYVGAVVVFKAAPYEPVALILPVWTAAVVAAGLALRSNDDYVRALEEQTRSAVAFRDSEVLRHVGEERLRIARDLHDSVAHTVSIISVHAGAAERYLDRDAERTREALRNVRATSRAVIGELQDILSVIRDRDSGDAVTEEVPGVEALDALVESTRQTGVLVTARLSPMLDIDRSVSVTAYRIAQESLTNALKHGAGDVAIDLMADETHVRLTVSNQLAPHATTGQGFGLLGMRERAASIHGSVRTGARGDRFVVRAELPTHPHQSKGGIA